ncbi:MAG TPA: hypothetical protein VFD82_05255 [Planctomycetota bacterium]|nr:hypothetical protein [Planctomycetota bacterium]
MTMGLDRTASGRGVRALEGSQRASQVLADCVLEGVVVAHVFFAAMRLSEISAIGIMATRPGAAADEHLSRNGEIKCIARACGSASRTLTIVSKPDAIVPDFAGEVAPLSEIARRYSAFGTTTNGSAIVVAPMPWVAPQAHAFWLFEPLSMSDIPPGLSCPSVYRTVLCQTNGCFAFEVSLYGIPSRSGLLDRSTLRPHSLVSANQHWRREFVGATELFHFGGGPHSESEDVGYFFDGDHIIARRKGGEETGRWTTFRAFLREELSRAEQIARSDQEARGAWGTLRA